MKKIWFLATIRHDSWALSRFLSELGSLLKEKVNLLANRCR